MHDNAAIAQRSDDSRTPTSSPFVTLDRAPAAPLGRPKKTRAPRTRKPLRQLRLGETPLPPAQLGVVEQVRLALKPRHRLATLLGFALGGFVPIACYFVAHFELSPDVPLYTQRALYLVLGGLAYSARTVWQWGRVAFANALKATGFVLLLEGVMVTSHIGWLGIAALVYLIAINGIATGCQLTTSAGR